LIKRLAGRSLLGRASGVDEVAVVMSCRDSGYLTDIEESNRIPLVRRGITSVMDTCVHDTGSVILASLDLWESL